jgi:glycosyltransferase involved in cell wall biosynthesis
MDKEANSPFYSIVIPVFNEEENLRLLWAKLLPAAQSLEDSFEIIFIDDGSKDKSFNILNELKKECGDITVIKLRRNYGQHPATIAGFDHARGNFVLTLDADLQNNPDDLKVIASKLKEGFDIISGVRAHRKDSFLRRKLPSMIVNKFIAKRTGFIQNDTGCFLKGYTLKAAHEVGEHTDIGGFITATIGTLGFKYSEVTVGHAERAHGVSRYGILAQLDQFMSIFTGYSRRPFQFVEIVGGFIFISGLALLVLSLSQLFYPRPLYVLMSLIVLSNGLVLGSVGIVGEYVIRTFKLSRRSPHYLVDKIIR